MTCRRSLQRLRVALAVLTMVIASMGVVALVAPAKATTTGFDPAFPRVAVIDYTDCNPTCATGASLTTANAPMFHFVDAPRRRMYAYNAVDFNSLVGPPRGVAVVDADRLVQTGWVDLSGAKLPSDRFRTFAFDATRRRMFVGETSIALGCDPPVGTTTCAKPGRLAVVDLTTSAPNPVVFNLPATGTTSTARTPPEVADGDQVVGLTFDNRRQRLYVLTASLEMLNATARAPVDPKGVSIAAYDASAAGTPTHLWTDRIRACSGPLGQRTGPAYFDVSEDGTFLYTACRGISGGITSTVPQQVTMHGVIRVNVRDDGTAIDPTAKVDTEFFPFAGNLSNGFATGDPGNDRVAIGVSGGGGQRLYVFDAARRSWVASMLMGDKNVGGGAADPASGRVYVLNQDVGIRYVDASALPAILGQPRSLGHAASFTKDIAVDPITRRIFVPGPNFAALPGGTAYPQSHLWVFEDRTPRYRPEPTADPDKATHDIDEKHAAQVSYTAAGSAYGARTLFVGGIGAMPGVGLASNAVPAQFEALKPESGDRGLFFGQVSRAQLSGELGRGEAVAAAIGATMDDATASDLKGKYGLLTGPIDRGGTSQGCDTSKPGSECASFDSLTADVGQLQESTCSDFGNSLDPKNGSKPGSKVTCRALDRVEAWASATADQPPADLVDGVSLSVAYSDAEVDAVKRPDGGVITTSAAVARGVTVTVVGAGTLSIGEVRSVATTRANGRPEQATSTLDAVAKNVRIVDAAGNEVFSCGVPGVDGPQDECEPAELAFAINRHFAPRVIAQGPRQDLDPDKVGAPKKPKAAAQAIVVKDPYALWSDANVNGDSRREVSGLDLAIYNDGDEASRFIVQLAAVYSEAQYQIGEPKRTIVLPPTKLTIDLEDKAGQPLAGGVFRVAGGDVLDLDAAPARTCVTTDDGVGDCIFDDLEAGSYSVTQTAAPAGYAAGPDTPVVLSPGLHTRASFTNLRAVGQVVLGLADEGGDDRPAGPLAGGSFDLHADNGDLRLGDGDRKVGSCTTDAAGICQFDDVPLGAYVVHQAATPDGYLTADDVGFKLDQPEQSAVIRFVVGLAPVEGTAASSDATAAAPIENARDTAFVDAPTETASVDITTPPSEPTRVRTSPFRERRSLPERAIAAPSEALSFLARKPRQALLFVLMWMLLLSPAYLAVRRHTLIVAKGVV